jgi:PAS domain S-box-containing protein
VGTFGEIWLLWWSADVLGILLLAPVILAWRQSSQWGADGKPSAKVIEAALFLVLLTLAAVTIMMIARYVNLGMRYLFLPFLIWAGYRLGIRGTAAAGLWIAILTTWFSIAGYTNFSRLGLTPRMQVAAHQLFLAAITLTGLFLAVALKERRRMEEGLRESEAVYKAMFENNQAVKYLVDPENGRIVEANSAAADYYGYPLSKLQGMTIFEINSLSSAEVRRRMTEAKQLKRYHFYFPHRLASGEVREVEVYGGPIVIQGRDLLFSIVHDITERKQAEKALAEREEKFRHLFNNAQVGMFRTKIDGSEILDVNEKFLEIFGRNKEEMVNAPSVIHWDDPGEREEMIRRLNLEGRVIDFECGMLTKQGERRDCLTSLKIYPEEGILEGSIIDITERKRNEELIKSSLKEKEVLLKEIHHRVKNNLAVISSIIRLQARQTKDPTSKEIMQECDNRIQSMAKIHSKIYQSKDLAGIDFDSYLKELIKDLFKSYQVNPERVKVHLQVRDLKQDLQTTVPLCLILNELISNALKYAFPEGRTGEIGITLQRENGRIGLTIADNGIGFPEEVDFRNTSSLGFQLVMALVKQLHGTIELERKEGTAFIIRFDDEKVEGKEKTSRRLRVEG